MIGEVHTAYLLKYYDNRDHIAIVDGEEAGKLMAAGWIQIPEIDYQEHQHQCTVLDLRKQGKR